MTRVHILTLANRLSSSFGNPSGL